MNQRSITSNAFFLAFVQFASKGISALISIVLARHFGAEAFGQYAIALTITTVAVIFTDLGFEQELVRRVSRNNEVLYSSFGAIIAILFPLITIVLISTILLTAISDYSIDVFHLVVILSLWWFFTRFQVSFQALMQAILRADRAAVVQAISLGLLVATLMILMAADHSVKEIATAQAAVAAITVGIWIFVTRNILFKTSVDKSTVKSLLKGASQFALQNAAWTLYFHVDTLILSYFVSEAEVGIYTAIFRLIFVLYIVPNEFVRSASPALYQKFSESRHIFFDLSSTLTTLMCLMAFPAVTIILLYADTIVPFIFGQDFVAGVDVAKILAVAVLCRFMTFGMLETLTTSDNQWKRVFLQQVTLFINIGLNFWLIPTMGILGAAYATSASEAILLLLSIAFFAGLKFPIIRWGDLKVILYFFILAIAAPGSLLVLDHPMLPLPVLFVYASAALYFLYCRRFILTGKSAF